MAKAKKLEQIIREGIDIPALAEAIRAEGYKTQKERKAGKKIGVSIRSVDRFKKLKDGWIRDTLLGLDWGPSSTTCMNWKAAKQDCTTQGGRLPEINELHSLVDYTKCNPAINPIFTDIKTDDYYWTNTLVAGYPGYAWHVHFYNGYVGYWGKDSNSYVRPVRSSQ
jgi:hypothetical protein